jgi:hypothetical protein
MASSRPAWSPHRSVAAFVLALSSSPAGLAQPSDGATETGPSDDAVATSVDEPARPRVILLLRTPGDDDTMVRLRFELHDYGWRILELRPDDRYETEPLATAAEREGATAAVRVDGPRGAVELWVRAPQGPVGETFTAPGERAPGQVLALRVAEALRARGLLVPPAPSRAVAESPPPQPPPAREPDAVSTPPREHSTPAAAPPRLSLELGPGVALSPGGLAPLPIADLGVRLELARIWSLSAVGTIPLATQRIGGAEGEADVSTFVAGGLVELEWARFSFGGLRSGAGAGLSVSSMSGRARSGFDSSHELVTVFTPLVRTSLHAHLAPWLRLRAGLAGGATFPTVRVAFGSREVASWGRPFVIASAAFELSPIQ